MAGQRARVRGVCWAGLLACVLGPGCDRAPRGSGEVRTEERRAVASREVASDPGRVAVRAVAAATPRTAAERSPLADRLGEAGGDGAADVRIVREMLAYYRSRFGAFPAAADNRQMVNALAGNNPGRLALIAREHPAIGPRGELMDRWGTPFFFHHIGRDLIEVRSAGPDRSMWTGDDMVEANRPVGSGRGEGKAR